MVLTIAVASIGLTALVRFSKQQYFLHLASDVQDNSKFWRNFSYLPSCKEAPNHPDVNVICEDIFLSIAENTVSDLPSLNTFPLHYINTCDDVPSTSMSEVDVEYTYF